jgi:hypothetical protein
MMQGMQQSRQILICCNFKALHKNLTHSSAKCKNCRQMPNTEKSFADRKIVNSDVQISKLADYCTAPAPARVTFLTWETTFCNIADSEAAGRKEHAWRQQQTRNSGAHGNPCHRVFPARRLGVPSCTAAKSGN